VTDAKKQKYYRRACTVAFFTAMGATYVWVASRATK